MEDAEELLCSYRIALLVVDFFSGSSWLAHLVHDSIIERLLGSHGQVSQ